MPGVRKLLPWSALLVLTVLPVMAGLFQHQRDGWYPESDDATIVLLADDTLRGDPSLVGMISTGGGGLTNPELHHPGPLELYLIAPFTQVLGPGLGSVLAAALIAVVSIASLVAGLYALGGRALAGVGFVTCALTLWGVGGEAPVSVWNPYVVLLPFACFLVFSAAAAAGRFWCLSGMVAFGSLVAQTHLSYAGLVGVVVLWTVAATAWLLVRGRDAGARPEARRAIGVSVLVGLALWLPPLLDQVRGEPGNLGQIWRSFKGSGGDTVGWPGLGELGRVVGVPLAGLSPRGDLIRVMPDATASDLVPLAVLLILLVGVGVLSLTPFRGRRRTANPAPEQGARGTDHRSPSRSVRSDVTAVICTVLVAVGAGAVTATRIPLSDGVQYHYYGLWMWPLATVTWTLLAWSAWRLVPRPRTDDLRRLVAGPWAPVALVLVVAVASALPRPGAWEPWAAHRRVAGKIAPAAADSDVAGPVLVRFRGATPYLSTGSAVIVAVESSGRDVLVDPGAPTPVFPWREFRRFTDQPVEGELWVVGGSGTEGLPDGSRLLSSTPTLDEAALGRLEAALDMAAGTVADGVHRGPMSTSDQSLRARIAAATADPVPAFMDGELASLAARGLVSVDGLSADDLLTLDRMRALRDEEQVSLYLVTAEQGR